MDGERIILGSGYLYIKLFDGTLPATESICTDENRLSYIQGGATLEYKPTTHKAVDDLGKVSKVITTEEVATLKSGLMTLCGNTLGKLVDTARITEEKATTAKAGKRTVKIGGIGNQDRKKYVLCFQHLDPVDGDIYVTIVGRNEAGLSLAFAKDKETIVDAEFTAQPHDEEGTLIQYEEILPKLAENG